MNLSAEDFFRAQCANYVASLPPETKSIRTISAVGALKTRFGENDKDSAWMTQILRYLLRSGVPIDPDFEIDTVNFKDGRDFLQEKNQADLVFVAWILRAHMMRVTSTFSAKEAKKQSLLKLETVLSPHHRDEHWNKRALDAKAKFVITHGDTLDLGTQCFTGFTPVIPTLKHVFDEKIRAFATTQDLHGAGADMPDPYFGFSVDPEYHADLVLYASDKTALGRRLRQAL